MITLFKNIVFLLITFNILTVNASSVDNDFVEEEEKKYTSAEFKSALNLPHPIVFKQILDKKDNTSSGRLFAIAYYFDSKYKNDAIEYDFSEDVEIIFPELSPEEVIDRTNLIRKAVKTYRWGKKKYTDLAIEMAAPEEPPLLVDDDEYAILGTVDYIPTQEGSFAVIDDFKKVVSYSDNPKDIKAMEAYHLRKLSDKENKTDYEKFKYMLNKIELSKIPSYGIDLPNPFVGNAGIGKWVEQDNFKVRSISELSQIYNSTKIIVGLHINTPIHRFMLANSLSKELLKPQITLTETHNIKSYEVFYPLSIPAIDDKMIFAYSDDFMFPVLIETIDPNEDVFFNTKITFQDCDIRLDCVQREITAPLYIEKGLDNNSSSIKNFIRQSYYNIPTEENNSIILDNAYIDLNADGETAKKINLTFSHKENPKNFSILIEDDEFTTFSAPQVNMNDNKIYVSVIPLSNQKSLINKPLTITVKLNGHSYFRKKINLNTYSVEHKKIKNISDFIAISYISGLLFNIMPIGLMILLLSLGFINVKGAPRKKCVYHLIISATAVLSSILSYIYIRFFNIDIYWGSQYSNTLYLSCCTIICLVLYLSLKYKQTIMQRHLKLKAILFGIIIVLYIPFSCIPYLAQNFTYTNIHDPKLSLIFILSTIIGVITPYLLIALWLKKITKISQSAESNQWISVIKKYVTLISLVYLIGLFVLQITFTSIIKIVIIFIIAILLYKYFFNFIEALYKTNLSDKKKFVTENIVLILATLFTVLFISKIDEKVVLKLNHTPILPTQEQIDNLLRQNKNILVSITPNWSYTARLNEIITFNSYSIERLKKNYNLEYISIKTPYVSPQILKYINSYNRYDIPIYVLYTINTNKGIVLPNIIKDSELEKTIRNFMI